MQENNIKLLQLSPQSRRLNLITHLRNLKGMHSFPIDTSNNSACPRQHYESRDLDIYFNMTNARTLPETPKQTAVPNHSGSVRPQERNKMPKTGQTSAPGKQPGGPPNRANLFSGRPGEWPQLHSPKG